MESYYLHDGTQRTGPFTVEELKSKNISENQAVWAEGMKDWTEASRILSLQPILVKTPPEFRPVSQTEKIGKQVGKSGKPVIIVLGMIAVFVIGYVFYGHLQRTTAVSYPNLSNFVDPEHRNPATYLVVAGNYRPNLWGNKEQISGTITNNASHTNYKDIHIQVNFLSQTKTVIGVKEYVVYQFVPYGSSVPFNVTVDKPAATATIGCSAVGGTYY
jgi:GYF domain 2